MLAALWAFAVTVLAEVIGIAVLAFIAGKAYITLAAAIAIASLAAFSVTSAITFVFTIFAPLVFGAFGHADTFGMFFAGEANHTGTALFIGGAGREAIICLLVTLLITVRVIGRIFFRIPAGCQG